MKNCIVINGLQIELTAEQAGKIELTEEQIEQIRVALQEKSIRLGDKVAGDTAKIGEYEMIVLGHTEEGTLLICKDFIETCTFGDSNNYDGSKVDKICNDFATKLAKIVGEDNMILHDVDLTADDGLKDYGSVQRFVSLLTSDRYRQYVYTLDKYKPDDWWWLATADSTPTHENANWVKCVSPSGYLDSGLYGSVSGVRPFCILKSDIFVSA